MDINAEQKRMITRYLLGEMSGQERSKFEDRYLEDSVLFEEITAVEDELMRRYACGDLPEAERTAFEARYLKDTDNRRRVDFAKTLMDYVSSTHGPADVSDGTRIEKQRHKQWRWMPVLLAEPGNALRLIAALMLVAMIAGISWLAVMDTRLHRAFEQMQVQHAGDLKQEQELRNQLAQLNLRLQQQEEQVAQLSSLGAMILPFRLSPHLMREGSSQKPLIIPEGFPAVFLESTLSSFDYEYGRAVVNAYVSYSASLETPEGRQIWRQSGLKSWQTHNGPHMIGLILPSRIFQSGNYILKVSGKTATGRLEEVDSYVFRVIKR